jgi:hypothetical protein
LDRGLRSEMRRSLTLLGPSSTVRKMAPSPDRVAATFARNVERIGLLLGLERRPMGEMSDREHRTEPHDDRPEMSFLARLKRRIFP